MAEGIRDQQLLNDFLTAHPSVTINLVDSQKIPDAADDLDSYFTELDAYARSADVLFFDSFNLGLSPLATRAGYLLDLAPLVNSDPEALEDDFYPQLWNAYQWDNGIWGLPFSVDMMLLIYNKSAFDRANLPYPDGNWTLEQFVDAATQLTVRDANNNVINSGFANTGRIFREGFWRTLFDADAVDASSFPTVPQFSRPDIEAVMEAYHQLEEQGVIGSDASSAAMFIDFIRKVPDPNYDWALLPGNRGVLLASGIAVSAGTQQPELAYELAKYMTTISAMSGPIPVRLSTTSSDGIVNFVQPPYQPLVQQAFDQGLTISNLRFGDYLNDARWTIDDIEGSARDADDHALSDLHTADEKRTTLAITVIQPVVPTLPPGKIAINFDVVGERVNDVNQTGWSQVIGDFTTSDPQVGLVNVRNVQESASTAASESDCFYYASNAVPTITDNSLLDLTPLLSVDPDFDPNDLISGTLPAVQRGNQTLALPINLLPFVLYYDSTRFADASLPAPNSNWTVSDFASALDVLKPGSEGHSPFVDGESQGAYLLVLIASYGGIPLDFRTNPPTINFNDPATVDAIRQVLDLARNGNIRYSALSNLEGQSLTPAPDNTTAIYPSMLNRFARKVPRDMPPDLPVLFPRGEQYNGVAYNLGAGYISAGTSYPEACYRFISLLAQHPDLFSSMPVRRSLLSDPDFTSSTSPELLQLYQDLDQLLQDPHTVPFQNFDQNASTAASFLYERWLFEAFDSYVLNDRDLDVALQDAQTYANAFQTCAVNLPPIDLASTGKGGDMSAVIPYVDCAQLADSRLQPLLDPLVGR
jgi:ABC-type glycerol-3-phosphate transport system substrate-binding protein